MVKRLDARGEEAVIHVIGGAAIALVKIDDLSRVQVAVDNAFGEHAFGQPDTFVVTASDGAARN